MWRMHQIKMWVCKKKELSIVIGTHSSEGMVPMNVLVATLKDMSC